MLCPLINHHLFPFFTKSAPKFLLSPTSSSIRGSEDPIRLFIIKFIDSLAYKEL